MLHKELSNAIELLLHIASKPIFLHIPLADRRRPGRLCDHLWGRLLLTFALNFLSFLSCHFLNPRSCLLASADNLMKYMNRLGRRRRSTTISSLCLLLTRHLLSPSGHRRRELNNDSDHLPAITGV